MNNEKTPLKHIRKKPVGLAASSSQASITSNQNETQTKQVEESIKTGAKLGIEKEIENIFESENFINLVSKYSDESIFNLNSGLLQVWK